MTPFADDLNRVLKYGAVPADEIKAMTEAVREGGNFDPNNTAAGVLADRLEDSDDVRHHIVRRDLQYRSHPKEYHGGYEQHLLELLGGDEHFPKHVTVSEVTLPDGTEFRHSTKTHRTTGKVAHDLRWFLPASAGRAADFQALFTPEEATKILSGLGLKSQHLTGKQKAE